VKQTKLKKPNIASFCSYEESRCKVKKIEIIMGQECKGGLLGGISASVERKGEGTGDEENIHI
jgi:hypothetical protein